MKQIFEIRTPCYRVRSDLSHCKRESIRATDYDFQPVRYLRPKAWDMIRNTIKNCNPLNEF